MSRRSLARVVFPLDEHPLMPMMMVRVSSIIARKGGSGCVVFGGDKKRQESIIRTPAI